MMDHAPPSPKLLTLAETLAITKYEGLFNDQWLLFLDGGVFIDDSQSAMLDSDANTLIGVALEKLSPNRTRQFHHFLQLIVRHINHWKRVNKVMESKALLNLDLSSMQCCLLYSLAEFNLQSEWCTSFIKKCPSYLSTETTSSGDKTASSSENQSESFNNERISKMLFTALRVGGYPWEEVIKHFVNSNVNALAMMDDIEQLPPFLLAAIAPSDEEGDADSTVACDAGYDYEYSAEILEHLRLKRVFEKPKSLIAVNNSYELLRCNPEVLVGLISS